MSGGACLGRRGAALQGCGRRAKALRHTCLMLSLSAIPVGVWAQTTRLAVLQAEDRRAASTADLYTLRAGARSGDPQIVRLAVRAIGRLERPALIADITPALRHALPEVRAEAATAIGQAAQGWKREPSATAAPIDAALAALNARLKVEADADVRGPEAGIARIDEALLEAARAKQHWLDAELQARRGDLLLRNDPPDRPGAEAAFRRSLAVAREQGTKAFELRAALRLARLAGSNDAASRDLLRGALDGVVVSASFPESIASSELLAHPILAPHAT